MKKRKKKNTARKSGAVRMKTTAGAKKKGGAVSVKRNTAAAAKKTSERQEDTGSYKWLVIITAFLTSATFCLIGPLELYFSNINELWFHISAVLPCLIGVFAIVFAVLAGLGLALKRRVRAWYICVIFGLGLALYLQRNYLNSGMEMLDGRTIDWLASPLKVALNSAEWIACIALPILAYHYFKKYWATALLVLSAIVIGMQATAVVFLGMTAEKDLSETVLSTDGMFSLSDDKNIIVFVVDTFDAVYFEDLVMNEPEYEEMLQDFTYFDNTISGGVSTIYGLPLLLTGQYYDGGDYNEYLQTSYDKIGLYAKLKDNNYDVRLYTGNTFVTDSFANRYIDNTASSDVVPSSTVGLTGKLYQFVGYEYMPVAVKNQLYLYSGEFDQFRESAGTEEAVTPYKFNDAEFIQRFRDQGLTIDSGRNVFRFYHLSGSHPPYHLDENGEYSEEATTVEEQTHGVMNMIADYIDELRSKGIYDNSTIIITGDHGTDLYGIKSFYLCQCPTFLIKPSGTENDGMKISHAPITFQNVLPTLSWAVDGHNGEKERTVFEIGEDEQLLRYHVAISEVANTYFGYDKVTLPQLFSTTGEARDTASFTHVRELSDSHAWEDVCRFDEPIPLTTDNDALISQGIGTESDGASWLYTEAIQSFLLEKQPEGNMRADIELRSVYAGGQYVTVFYNDVCVFSGFLREKYFSFVVPHDAVADGRQTIHYECSSAAPADYGSGEGDRRKLSIKLFTMTLSDTKADATVTEPVSLYTWGDTIGFATENDGRRYFANGIDNTLAEGGATIGNTGRMCLHAASTEQDLIAEFQFEDVFSPPQRFIAKWRDQTLFDGVVTSPDDVVTFSVPAECVVDGRLLLDLEYPDAVSPKSIGEGNNARVLAFQFSSIRISSAE